MDSRMARRLLVGLVLIAIGGLFLAGQFGLVELNPGAIASTWWPVILIFIGLSSLIGRSSSYRSGSVIWSLFMIFLGVGFLLRNLDILPMDMGDYFKLLIPVVIILFGVRMIIKPSQKQKTDHYNDYSYKYEYKYEYGDPSGGHTPPSGATDGEPSYPYQSPPPPPPKTHGSWQSGENRTGFIGDLYLGHDYWELKPMNVSHFIGDTIIDLTKAQIPYGETRLNISAFIGDVKVFVPNDIDVEFRVQSSSFLGDITIFNRREGGFLRSLTEESPGYNVADKKVKLQCSLFIGDIHVQRVG